MSLVSSMPRKAHDSRLSADPVHFVHGHYFSIRDCAVHAIDAAYAENLDQTAHEYEEQARKLIFSYDKRVYIRVSRVFDRKRLRYLFICAACMLFGALLALIYSLRNEESAGLLILIAITVGFAVVSAVMASLTTWRKRKILYHNMASDHKSHENDPES